MVAEKAKVEIPVNIQATPQEPLMRFSPADTPAPVSALST